MADRDGAWTRLALIQAANQGGVVLENVAAHWGYRRQVIAIEKPEDSDAGETAFRDGDLGRGGQTEVEDKPKRPPALFPRILRIETLETRREDWQKPAFLSDPTMGLRPEDSPPGTFAFGPPKPLLPVRRLLPLLFNALNQARSAHTLDVRRLLRRIARGQTLQKLPKAKQARWPRRLLMIIDADQALEPYWADFEYWVKQLQVLLGDEAMAAIRFDDRRLGEHPSYAMRWPGKADEAWFVWQPPAVDTAVLIFSDLGQLDSRRAVRWQRQLAGLRSHPAPLLTLSPAACADAELWDWLRPSPYNDRNLNSHPRRNGFNLHAWASNRDLSATHLKPLRLYALEGNEPVEGPTSPDFEKPVPSVAEGLNPNGTLKPSQAGLITAPDIDTILAWLSALPLIDVGLLRLLRQNMNWGDSSLEGIIWNHPHLRHIGIGIRVREALTERYRAIYRQRLDREDDAKTFWECVSKHHHNAYAGLKHLESLNRCGLEQTDDPVMRDYFARLCKTVLDEKADPRQQALLRQQCQTILDSRPKSLWWSDLSELLYPIYAAVHADKIRAGEWPEELEPGFEPERLRWFIETKPMDANTDIVFQLRQVNADGLLECKISERNFAEVVAEKNQPLVSFEANRRFPIKILRNYGGVERVFTAFSGMEFSLTEGETVAVETRGKRFEFDVIRKPSWASRIWSGDADHEHIGLFVELDWAGSKLTGKWGKKSENYGWLLPEPFGEDQYGLYADLTVNHVTQRFRWIEPGSFMMGSPPDEAERTDYETQHPVTLTQGFWLADTAVTQALWLAVMHSENPSYFKDNPNNPVEQVSWEDAQTFIARLNESVPGLQAQLPSEAQWEYACRAGTATPFSFGANITPEQVNYDGDYPYAGGEKGLNRGKTVAVKSLPANAWGLYEMHGNVWEWCADAWQDNLGESAVVDPYTSGEPDARRVLRGGSWYYYGRSVRSALRAHRAPGNRDHYFGFRLALGHTELKPGPGGGAVKPVTARDAPWPDSGVAEQPPAGRGAALLGKLFGKGRKKK
ncbi:MULTISPECIES: formylglycine-generating enzyme family protein [Methylomonas]|uniref:formylglycine-generating enzyme family protein n=1 Tax=Methylomonas TaxID=416 RepID=UPI0007C94F0E|nr:formylglycine-generating enzyme family protein [Methylomonas koyamae]